jgi:molybdopterin converting factor small subunit
MKHIKVQYYAVFREQKGMSEETVSTESATAADLYRELGLRLDPAIVRASINLQFKPMTTELCDGDAVVFIPPVAGG